MANKKTTKTTTKTTTRSSSSSVWSINKISFWTIVLVTLLYVVSLVLAACGINLRIIGALQGVATAIMISIVSVLAWRFVRSKPSVWKVLYIICLLVVIAGIIVPLVV